MQHLWMSISTPLNRRRRKCLLLSSKNMTASSCFWSGVSVVVMYLIFQQVCETNHLRKRWQGNRKQVADSNTSSAESFVWLVRSLRVKDGWNPFTCLSLQLCHQVWRCRCLLWCSVLVSPSSLSCSRFENLWFRDKTAYFTKLILHFVQKKSESVNN